MTYLQPIVSILLAVSVMGCNKSSNSNSSEGSTNSCDFGSSSPGVCMDLSSAFSEAKAKSACQGTFSATKACSQDKLVASCEVRSGDTEVGTGRLYAPYYTVNTAKLFCSMAGRSVKVRFLPAPGQSEASAGGSDSPLSCMLETQRMCADFPSSMNTQDAQSLCNLMEASMRVKGTFSKSTCPTANLIGTCDASMSGMGNIMSRYYSPEWDATSAEKDCTTDASPGTTFTEVTSK